MKHKDLIGKTIYCHSWLIKRGKHLIRASMGGMVTEHALVIAVARCSHKDRFEKAVGRALIDERIIDSPHKLIAIGEANDISRILQNQALMYFKSLGKVRERRRGKSVHMWTTSNFKMVEEAVTE